MSKGHYIDNEELLQETIACKAKGEMSNKLAKMLMMIVEKSNTRLTYKDSRDAEDCKSVALFSLCKYWNRFDPSKSKNAFGYFTQIAKFGFAQGWGVIHPKRRPIIISMDFGWLESDSTNYNEIIG